MDDQNDTMFTFTWIIEDYPCGFAFPGEDCYFTDFFVECVSDLEWRMRLFPNGEKDEGFISCEMSISDNVPKSELYCKLEILDRCGIIRHSQMLNRNKTTDYSRWISGKTLPIIQFCDDMNNAAFSLRVHFMSKTYTVGSFRECIEKSKFYFNKYLNNWIIEESTEYEEKKFKFNDVTYKADYDRHNNNFIIRILQGFVQSHCIFCTFSLLDSRGEKTVNKSVIYEFKNKDDTVQFPIFFNKEILAKREYQGIKDRILLLCEFYGAIDMYTVSKVYTDNCSPLQLIKSNPQSKLNPSSVIDDRSLGQTPKALVERFQKMYLDKVFSDVQFRVNNKVFSAHRSVLSIQSPVFLAMFNQDMTEKHSGIVEITDVDPEIFDIFLRFFYSGKVDNLDTDKTLKLLTLGDKYDVKILVEKCADYLSFVISTENVLDVLLAADATNQTSLKNAAVSYIKSDAKIVLKSNQWKQLIISRTELVTEILAEFSDDLANASENNDNSLNLC